MQLAASYSLDYVERIAMANNASYTLAMIHPEDSAVAGDLKKAQEYLNDTKGAALTLTGDQFERAKTAITEARGEVRFSNNDLAELEMKSFAALHNDVLASSIVMNEQVKAVGNLVAACHADNIAKLNELQSSLQVVSNNVIVLGNTLNTALGHLVELRNDFNEYVKKDDLVNNVQLAKQELITLNQKLESDFGHNKELRRTAVGILQANDLNVRTDTILTQSEELCITTPNYWLAPALVALASWVSASRDIASGKSASDHDVQITLTSIEAMLREAYRRECSKTTLFFGLICRRANNIAQANDWFKEYLSFQDPRVVDHTCMVLLNLYSGGLMGHGVEEQSILGTLADWLDELMADPSNAYQMQLINDWKIKCQELYELANPVPGSYSVLPAFSSTWPALQESMQTTTLHGALLTFLNTELEQKDFPEDDKTLIDGMIADLVTDYDADELPIRREQEYQQLIVDLNGKRKIAEVLRSIKDDILSETKSFVSILSDAARHSTLSGASASTAVYALRLQMPWVKKAYEEVVQTNHDNTPNQIQIELDNFTGATVDGTDEDRLVNEYVMHANECERQELEASKTGIVQKVALIGGAVLAIIGIIATIAAGPIGFIPLIGGIAAFGYGLFAATQARKKQQEIKARMASKRFNGVLIIRKFMAEVREWRKQYKANDEGIADVIEKMNSVSANLRDGVDAKRA